MLVKNESKVTEITLENGTVFRVGDDYGDGKIFNIQVGNDFENEIKDWDFEDWDDNVVPTSEVKLCLDIMDGEDGWSVYMTGDGKEVIEA